MRKTKNIYAAYKDDEFLVVGTAKEVADYWDGTRTAYIHICASLIKNYIRPQECR